MIFQKLSEIKRQSVMTSIILITVGIFMIICPEQYITAMIATLGSVMLVMAVVGVLNYLDSNKSLVRYIYLTGWLIVGIVGAAIILFEIRSLFLICWIFGAVLIISGLGSISSALRFAKPAGRKYWWMLIVLAVILIICGIIILVHPGMHSFNTLFKVAGVMMLFTSLVSMLRLIWLWPIKNA